MSRRHVFKICNLRHVYLANILSNLKSVSSYLNLVPCSRSFSKDRQLNCRNEKHSASDFLPTVNLVYCKTEPKRVIQHYQFLIYLFPASLGFRVTYPLTLYYHKSITLHCRYTANVQIFGDKFFAYNCTSKRHFSAPHL